MLAAITLTPSAAAAVLDAGLMLAVWALAVMFADAGPASLLFVAATPAAAYAVGLYRREAIAAPVASLGRLPIAAGLGGLAALAGFALLPRALRPAGSAAALFPFACASFVAAASLGRLLLTLLRRKGWFRARLLVLGAGARAWELAFLLRREGRQLAYQISFVHDPARGAADPRLADEAVLQPGNRPLLAIAREVGAETIVVALDERRGVPLDALMGCKIAGFAVFEYLAFLERELGRVDLKRMDMSWLLYGEGFSFGPLERWFKRGCDIVVSLAMLAVLSPLLLGGMLAVLLDGGFPIFYRQERVTRNGARFRILKLRTMRRDAEASGAVWAADRDPRITRAGAFLRRTRLDELPQLFNVLAGSMSLVGPRPERPEFVAALARQIPLYQERHAVKAGLTGWAQINYPYGASIDDARSKLSYDLYYIKKVGILLDVLIIAQTIRAVIWPSGVR